jgi:hypothetical protein
LWLGKDRGGYYYLLIQINKQIQMVTIVTFAFQDQHQYHIAPHVNIAFLTVFAKTNSYHPSNIYAMKVHVDWDHSSYKNVDSVAIQSSDPQALHYISLPQPNQQPKTT